MCGGLNVHSGNRTVAINDEFTDYTTGDVATPHFVGVIGLCQGVRFGALIEIRSFVDGAEFGEVG